MLIQRDDLHTPAGKNFTAYQLIQLLARMLVDEQVAESGTQRVGLLISVQVIVALVTGDPQHQLTAVLARSRSFPGSYKRLSSHRIIPVGFERKQCRLWQCSRAEQPVPVCLSCTRRCCLNGTQCSNMLLSAHAASRDATLFVVSLVTEAWTMQNAGATPSSMASPRARSCTPCCWVT